MADRRGRSWPGPIRRWRSICRKALVDSSGGSRLARVTRRPLPSGAGFARARRPGRIRLRRGRVGPWVKRRLSRSNWNAKTCCPRAWLIRRRSPVGSPGLLGAIFGLRPCAASCRNGTGSTQKKNGPRLAFTAAPRPRVISRRGLAGRAEWAASPSGLDERTPSGDAPRSRWTEVERAPPRGARFGSPRYASARSSAADGARWVARFFFFDRLAGRTGWWVRRSRGSGRESTGRPKHAAGLTASGNRAALRIEKRPHP